MRRDNRAHPHAGRLAEKENRRDRRRPFLPKLLACIRDCFASVNMEAAAKGEEGVVVRSPAATKTRSVWPDQSGFVHGESLVRDPAGGVGETQANFS